MSDLSIGTVLDALKRRLDENNLIDVYDPFGNYPKMGFRFNEPLKKEELEQLDLPAEYQDFLLLHNGAEFFTYEYGYSFCLYSLEKMQSEYESMKSYCDVEYILKNCYPIGYVVDRGPLLIDRLHSRVLLREIVTTNFYCNLTTWLDRMFKAQGHAYWDWYSNEE